MTSKLSVAIVGGGPAGLTSAKSALEQGLIPTVFEKSDVIGGIWKKEIGNVWSSMHANVSKFNSTFSDFPWPESTPLFPTANEIHSNLEKYVKNFNLEPYISCGNTVLKIVQQPNKKWNVQWKDNKTNQVNEKTFDFVIVASGMYTDYSIPDHDNMENYKGIIEHGQNYERLKKKIDLKGKKVIVVGASFSATDISADIVDQGATVISLMRRPYWILDRLALCDAENNIRMPFDFGFLSRKMSQIMSSFKTTSEKNIFLNGLFATLCKDQNEFPGLYIDPNSVEAAKAAVSTNYIRYVKSGKITVHRNEIAKFDDTGVFLKDNTHIDADVVLFCTGYKVKLDFLEKSVLDKMEFDHDNLLLPLVMYKTTFHPDIENFACVGMVKEPIFSIVELQGRWVSLVFSGKIKLPPRDKMLLCMEEEERKYRNGKLENENPHADFVGFADSLAKEINALPNLEDLKTTNPELYDLLYDGVFQPANFRIIDNPEIALKLMREAAKIKEMFAKNLNNLPLDLF